jgi:hypothetical protein
MSTPNTELDGDAAALARIETEAGRLLGLDLAADLGSLDRLRLNQATSLLIEISRIDHQQQQGLAIDPIRRGQMSGELAALISPAGPSAGLDRLDLTALSDHELNWFEILVRKAMHQPIEAALEPLDPASPEGRVVAEMERAHEARMRALSGPDLTELAGLRIEAKRLRDENLRLGDVAREARSERDAVAADAATLLSNNADLTRLVNLLAELCRLKQIDIPEPIATNVVKFRPKGGAA